VDKRGEDFYVILNDETREKLELDTLCISKENIPYIRVKNGEFEARFLRPAYYEFMKYLKKQGDNYYITSKGAKHILKRIP